MKNVLLDKFKMKGSHDFQEKVSSKETESSNFPERENSLEDEQNEFNNSSDESVDDSNKSSQLSDDKKTNSDKNRIISELIGIDEASKSTSIDDGIGTGSAETNNDDELWEKESNSSIDPEEERWSSFKNYNCKTIHIF